MCCKTADNNQFITINYDDSAVMYEGRIGKNEIKETSEIYWSGSSIKVNFEGTVVKVLLYDL